MSPVLIFDDTALFIPSALLSAPKNPILVDISPNSGWSSPRLHLPVINVFRFPILNTPMFAPFIFQISVFSWFQTPSKSSLIIFSDLDITMAHAEKCVKKCIKDASSKCKSEIDLFAQFVDKSKNLQERLEVIVAVYHCLFLHSSAQFSDRFER